MMPRGAGSFIQFGQVVVSSDSADLREVKAILEDVLKKQGYPGQYSAKSETERFLDEDAEMKKDMQELRDALKAKEEESKPASSKEPWEK